MKTPENQFLKSFISIFFLTLLPLTSFAQAPKGTNIPPGKGLGAFAGLTGGMGLGSPPMPMLTYGGYFTPTDKRISSTEQHRIFASTPVYKNGDDTYSVALGLTSLKFGEEITLSGYNIKVPTEFYKIELGGQFSRQLDGDRNFGVRLTIGSASDKPFQSSKDNVYSATMHYSFPDNENHWVLTLFASNNNPISNYIPIPGFIYFFKGKDLIGMFGVPFASIIWTPVDPWTFSMSAFGPSITTEAIYGHRNEMQPYFGAYWMQQSYLRHDRIHNEDRLYLEEKKLALGLRSPLSPKLSSDLQLGFAFNRSVYESSKFLKHELGAFDLDNSWFVGWNFRYIF